LTRSIGRYAPYGIIVALFACTAFARAAGLPLWVGAVVPIAGTVVAALGVALDLRSQRAEQRQRLQTAQSLIDGSITPLHIALTALAKGDLTAVKPKQDAAHSPGDRHEFSCEWETLKVGLDACSKEMTNTLSTWRHIILPLADHAQKVASGSAAVSDSALVAARAATSVKVSLQDVGKAVTETALTTEMVARSSEGLAMNATNAAQAVELLRQAIDQVLAGAKKQAVAGQEASDIARQSEVAMEQTIASMGRIEEQVRMSEKSVQELGAKQAQVESIVQTIGAIAEQTNLLALNAAIEAARAGEQGRGFAVVADEVRKLAEMSGEATKQIGGVIASISISVQEATKAMETSAREAQAGTGYSDETRAALLRILEAIGQVDDIALSNGRLVMEMVTNSQTVSEAIANVAAISQEAAAASEQLNAAAEEIAATTEEVLASMEEQEAGVHQASGMAQELAGVSDGLMQVVAQINTSDESEFAAQIAQWQQAHLNWVRRVETMVNGGKAIPKSELASHLTCALGKWYVGLGRAAYGNLNAFQKLEKPHARVHQVAAEAVDAVLSKDEIRAKQCVKDIRAASDEVVKGLAELAAAVAARSNGRLAA
jgi:methyl-accepting chemotaxis protein